MGAVLVFVLVVAFIVLPATLLYTLGLLLAGWKAGHLGAYFRAPYLTALVVAGGLILLALLLAAVFGKDLVVK